MILNFINSFLMAVGAASGGQGGYESVSIIRLLAYPEKFSSKPISTSGVVREYDRGVWVLYMDCESAIAEITSNGLSFRPDDEKVAAMRNANLKYVVIYGKFDGSSALPKLYGGSFSVVENFSVYPLFRESPGDPDIDLCRRRSGPGGT